MHLASHIHVVASREGDHRMALFLDALCQKLPEVAEPNNADLQLVMMIHTGWLQFLMDHHLCIHMSKSINVMFGCL